MPIISKKSSFILFSAWIYLSGALLYGQDLAESMWHLENTQADGISNLYLHLKSDGTAVLHYYQRESEDNPPVYHRKEEEWYPINSKGIIIQDYMGEFIVLRIAEESNSLEIDSPVAYFSGSFNSMNSEEWDEFLKMTEAIYENR